MKQLVTLVREFVREEVKPGYALTLLGFLAVAITLNYSFQLETRMRIATWGSPMAMVWYFIFYAIPYTFAVVPYAFWYNRRDIFRSGTFWIFSVSAIAILSINAGFIWHIPLIRATVTPSLQYFVIRCGNNLVSVLGYFTLTALYWWVRERNVMPLYGLRRGSLNARPFFLLLLCLIPIIVWASFQPDFLQKYPRYTGADVAAAYHIPAAIPTGIFELCYGMDFIGTEFFFRGFMVLALGAILGRGSVFPMVAVYCFLHFEKPLAEAISSIAGGFVLGVISYSFRSIFGGVIVHLGLAWMMEAAAFLQITFRS